MGLDNPAHIAILLVVLLLVFGARRLPEIGRSLGEGMRGFKDAITGNSGGERETLTAATHQQAPVPAPAPVPSEPAEQPVAASSPPPAASQ
jgi:sec-independent protein translocase protein TatA